jgi:hypothetical protein
MPWDEWVKKRAKCVHCSEKGHIRPTCPKYLAQIEAGEIQRPVKAASKANPIGKPTASKYRMKDRKARALLSVVQAFYGGDSDSSDSEEEASGAQDQENQEEERNIEPNNDDNDDIHSFLSMIGPSLKD